jgi:hypothetical protein
MYLPRFILPLEYCYAIISLQHGQVSRQQQEGDTGDRKYYPVYIRTMLAAGRYRYRRLRIAVYAGEQWRDREV